MRKFFSILLAVSLGLALTKPVLAAPDSSPHKSQFVEVAKGIKLEVLDWGGNGPPLVFLAGLTGSAHGFDTFAPKFRSNHHIYGITRRGVGFSTVLPPNPENYDTDRLADDIMTVLKALNIKEPVLIGHSFAGAEMSSIGSRYPNSVAGLVYLDAGYPRAFYDPLLPLSYEVDAAVVGRDLRRFQWASPKEALALIQEIQRTLPNLGKGLDWYARTLKGSPELKSQTDPDAIAHATLGGDHQYTNVKAPMLIFFAVHKPCQPNCKNNEGMWQAAEQMQRKSMREKYPDARIVNLANADHTIWKTNESDVIREVNAFLKAIRH